MRPGSVRLEHEVRVRSPTSSLASIEHVHLLIKSLPTMFEVDLNS